MHPCWVRPFSADHNPPPPSLPYAFSTTGQPLLKSSGFHPSCLSASALPKFKSAIYIVSSASPSFATLHRKLPLLLLTVMIIQDWSSGVCQHALPTRCVHVVMAGKHGRAAAFRARHAASIDLRDAKRLVWIYLVNRRVGVRMKGINWDGDLHRGRLQRMSGRR